MDRWPEKKLLTFIPNICDCKSRTGPPSTFILLTWNVDMKYELVLECGSEIRISTGMWMKVMNQYWNVDINKYWNVDITEHTDIPYYKPSRDH